MALSTCQSPRGEFSRLPQLSVKKYFDLCIPRRCSIVCHHPAKAPVSASKDCQFATLHYRLRNFLREVLSRFPIPPRIFLIALKRFVTPQRSAHLISFSEHQSSDCKLMCRAGDNTIHQTRASISSFICIRTMVQSLLYRFQSLFK
jgi:hypothetical protein